MTVESSSQDLIKRYGLTDSEVRVAKAAAQLIRRYRLESRGTWSGPTADQLVREEVRDAARQISVLTLACSVEKETR